MTGKKRPLTPGSEKEAHKRCPGAKNGVANDEGMAASGSSSDTTSRSSSEEAVLSAEALPPTVPMDPEDVSEDDMSSSSETRASSTHPNIAAEPQEASTPVIRLQSSDGKVFEVEAAVARMSNIMKQMLDDVGVDEDDVIPLPNVESDVLEKVIVWAKQHKGDPSPQGDDPTDDEMKKYGVYISTWDESFLQVDHEMLFKLIAASIYLDVKGLRDITCETVARMIRGRTPEEIRRLFNIANDLTPMEEQLLREENSWCDS